MLMDVVDVVAVVDVVGWGWAGGGLGWSLIDYWLV